MYRVRMRVRRGGVPETRMTEPFASFGAANRWAMARCKGSTIPRTTEVVVMADHRVAARYKGDGGGHVWGV